MPVWKRRAESGVKSIQPIWVGLTWAADQGYQGEADEGDGADRRQHPAPARAQGDEQPERLDRDREDGEVVAAEGKRRGQRPESEVPSPLRAQGTGEEEQRGGAEKDQQGV